MSKNVTFRFQESELKKYDDFAASIGVTRTKLVRKALENYINTFHGSNEDSNPSILDAGKELAGLKDYKKAKKHPLYYFIQTEGMNIKDDEENVIATIKDLESLLDFVDRNVLKR